MDPLWGVAAAFLLGSASVSAALVVGSLYVGRTVGARLTALAAAGSGHERWTGAILTEKDIGDEWARQHPEEAEAYNAGQMTAEQARAAVDTRPWEVDLEGFDQTWGAGLDELFEQERLEREARERGEPAVAEDIGAATREAEKSWPR